MQKKMTLDQYFYLLKFYFKLDKPVVMAVRKMKDQGSASDSGKRYTISVNKSLSLSEQKEVVCHEYAHLLAGWDEKKQHTDEWGIWYSRIYRMIQAVI